MKRLVLLIALFALALSAASFAVAKPPPGKNHGTTADPATCHPKVSVILKGDFFSGGGDSFSMDVKQSNFHGRDLVGKPLTLKVDAKTSFKRNGPAELAEGAPNDVAPPPLLAKRVTGHPAKASDSGSEGDGSTTTTTTP